MILWCDEARSAEWCALHPDLLGPVPSEVGRVFDALPERARVLELFPGARPPLRIDARSNIEHWQLDTEAWTLDPRRSRLVLGELRHLAVTPRLADLTFDAIVCATRLWPHAHDPSNALSRLARALAPGGRVALRLDPPIVGERGIEGVRATTRRDRERRIDVRTALTNAHCCTEGAWLEPSAWLDAATECFGNSTHAELVANEWLLLDGSAV